MRVITMGMMTVTMPVPVVMPMSVMRVGVAMRVAVVMHMMLFPTGVAVRPTGDGKHAKQQRQNQAERNPANPHWREGVH